MHTRSVFTILLLIVSFGIRPGMAGDQLPHEFGERVPLYPSAQLVETRYTRDSASVRFAIDGGYEHVLIFYREALEKAGWRILPAATPGTINAENGGSGTDEVQLAISESTAAQGHFKGFTIDLRYPGGRE